MGCVCSITRQIGADVDIRKEKVIKVNLKTNNITNQNQNQKEKEDIIIETKIPETAEISQDKNNKLKIIEEKEKKDEIKGEEKKIEKNENGILSKNHYNQRVFELINEIRLKPPDYSKTILDNIENIISETHRITNKESGIIKNKQTMYLKKR